MKSQVRDPHEAWVLERATHFTGCIFLGRGKYDTIEYKTLEEAREKGQERANNSGKGVMIYAVFGIHQGHIENVIPDNQRKGTS